MIHDVVLQKLRFQIRRWYFEWYGRRAMKISEDNYNKPKRCKILKGLKRI